MSLCANEFDDVHANPSKTGRRQWQKHRLAWTADNSAATQNHAGSDSRHNSDSCGDDIEAFLTLRVLALYAVPRCQVCNMGQPTECYNEPPQQSLLGRHAPLQSHTPSAERSFRSVCTSSCSISVPSTLHCVGWKAPCLCPQQLHMPGRTWMQTCLLVLRPALRQRLNVQTV